MTIDDVNELAEIMTALYGDRFPGLTPAMAYVWQEDLAHLEMPLVRTSLRRWVRFHTDRAPSLDQLLEQVEIVREDQHLAKRASGSTKSVAEILRETFEAAQAAQEARTDTEATFGKLMITLLNRSSQRWVDEQGVWHEKLTVQERATQCYEWARQYPDLAQDLQYQARKYAEQHWAEEQQAPA